MGLVRISALAVGNSSSLQQVAIAQHRLQRRDVRIAAQHEDGVSSSTTPRTRASVRSRAQGRVPARAPPGGVRANCPFQI